jgi:putative two-component system response regulator
VVDDLEVNVSLLRRLLEPMGYAVTGASDGAEALHAVRENPPDVIVLDVVMPGLDGFEVCEQLKCEPATAHIPVIMVSGAGNREAAVRALEVGADEFIHRPIDVTILDARIRSCVRNKMLHDQIREYQHRLEGQNEELEKGIRERTRQLERTQHAIVFSLAKLAESRDPETGEHLDRIRRYSLALAEEYANAGHEELTTEFLHMIYHASPLHDVGKVGIPDRVLLKPGKLTKAEFDVMKRHTIIGGETLRAAVQEAGGSALLEIGSEIVYGHHEWWNGNGYPNGVAGDDIPLSARIVAVADVYDALRTRRCYKEPFTHEKAVAIIEEDAGTHFDPDVVACFQRVAESFEIVHETLADSGEPTFLQRVIADLETFDDEGTYYQTGSGNAVAS